MTDAHLPLRQIADAATLRALSHPVRIALLETLTLGGAMTATEAGEAIGESSTTCSFHLRQLARYGFVEEAGGGKGRARPWKLTSIGLSIRTDPNDVEGQLAGGVLARLFRERQLARYQTWLEVQGTYPPAWRKAASESEMVFWLTPDELEALTAELLDLLLPRWRDRLVDPAARPPGAAPVEMLVFTYPMAPPPAEG